MRRKISYKVLREVLINDRHAHLVLKELEVESQDQAFISALVYTVLQNMLYLEYQFNDLIKSNTDKDVQIVLLMAAAQVYKMRDIPDYAVVSESVELTKQIGRKHSAGFVNAVLKKMIDRQKRPILGDKLDVLSIETSMPIWILKLLRSQYSEEFAIEYANYVQTIKPTYAWINELKPTEIDLSYFSNQDPLIAKSSLFKSELLKDAHVVIQDINSQAVVDMMPIEKGMRILDCCCAPGTKTLKIANRLENTGEIVGVELIAPRVKVTQELMKRANVLNTTILEGDASSVQLEGLFDIALIDAPCSGLGVLSHKHDLRYHIKPDQLDELQVIQAAILENIAQYIKIGGTLVYATCTLNKKENEKQIANFIEKNENFKVTYEKTYNPMETQGDGFYVAHCKRTW